MDKPEFQEKLTQLKAFFDLDVCQRATNPLRNGVEIAIFIDEKGPVSLAKQNDRAGIFSTAPQSPDMSFWITSKGVDNLVALHTEDIGDVGIAIMKMMLSKDEETSMRAKVHIGSFQLLRNGYLGVLPLGGSTLMKFLASKGFSNISKIKDAISNLRG